LPVATLGTVVCDDGVSVKFVADVLVTAHDAVCVALNPPDAVALNVSVSVGSLKAGV
jgi:hypothetical protein